MCFAIFPVHLSKLLRLPRKSDAMSYEVLHLSRKIISANLKIWGSKMQPFSGNQRPDLRTALMNMSFVLRLPRENASLQILFKCPTPAIVFGNATKTSRFAPFWEGAPCACHAKRALNVQKCSVRGVFCTFWLQKSGPRMVCFGHFDFEMCFAPQRLALFYLSSGQLAPHPPLQRAYFSTLRSPKSFEKPQCFATFLPFRASASSFFWLFLFYHLLSSALLFSLPLPISAFHLSILSEVWLLNFLRLPEAGMNTVSPARKPTGAKQQHIISNTCSSLYIYIYTLWDSSCPDLLQVRFQLLPKLNAWSSRLILALLGCASQLGSVITHI